MRERGMKSPDISIVIPVFNEAENIRPMYETLKGAMEDTAYAWEPLSTTVVRKRIRALLKRFHFHKAPSFRVRRNHSCVAKKPEDYGKVKG
jgi:glycosyltransferase involved in cell wall biosynthesis